MIAEIVAESGFSETIAVSIRRARTAPVPDITIAQRDVEPSVKVIILRHNNVHVSTVSSQDDAERSQSKIVPSSWMTAKKLLHTHTSEARSVRTHYTNC